MKTMRIAFNTEREMVQVLEQKGRSAGLNTDMLGNRNCHITVAPPFPKALAGTAVLGFDCRVRLGTFEFPLIDASYSVMEVEHFRHEKRVDLSDPDVRGGLAPRNFGSKSG